MATDESQTTGPLENSGTGCRSRKTRGLLDLKRTETRTDQMRMVRNDRSYGVDFSGLGHWNQKKTAAVAGGRERYETLPGERKNGS